MKRRSGPGAPYLLLRCAKPRKEPCRSSRCGAACGRSTAKGLCGAARGPAGGAAGVAAGGAGLAGSTSDVRRLVMPDTQHVISTTKGRQIHLSHLSESPTSKSNLTDSTT